MVVFIAYYSPEQYQLLLKYADDKKKLDGTWEKWLQHFVRLKTHLQNDFEVEDFPIDVQKMHDYFKSKKLKNNGSNRAAYTSEEGMKSYNRRINNFPEE
jgi:hypothetical protein